MILLLRLVAFVLGLKVLRVPSGVDQLESELDGMSWNRRCDVLQQVVLKGQLPLVSRIALAGPVLYMMSPLDLMPDFVPFIGHLDDQVALTAGLQIARIFASKDKIAAEINRFAEAA